jgi:DNA-binding GntR family transcriptional regulator
MEAAKLLEPKVVRVFLPRNTVHDEAELEAWLEEAKAMVLDKLQDGPVML